MINTFLDKQTSKILTSVMLSRGSMLK